MAASSRPPATGCWWNFPVSSMRSRCAVEIQRSMVDRNSEIAEDKRITFRVGVNLGDIIVDGDDIFGDGVNVAARLEALAEPGGICISRTVRDHIGDRLPYVFEDIGEQSVKNIARPVYAYALSAAAVAATAVRRAGATDAGRRPQSRGDANGRAAASRRQLRKSAPRLSIVVLPFSESVERSGPGIFRRRDHRRSDDRSIADLRQLRDRPQYRFYLQGQADRYPADRPRTRRPLCSSKAVCGG